MSPLNTLWMLSRRQWLVPIGALAALVVAGCGRTGLQAASSGSGDGYTGAAVSTGTAGSGVGGQGQGGSGGSSLPPGCLPELPGPKLVKIQLLDRSFCIDATEVTNADYEAWLNTAPDTTGQSDVCAWNDTFVPWWQVWPFPPERINHPVSGVDHCDAVAYCKSAGKRLCGSDEWGAACTKEGAQTYPYGNSFNFSACNIEDLGLEATVPVGSMPLCEGGYPGVFDLVGNVAEWVDPCEGTSGELDTCLTFGGSFWIDGQGASCQTVSGWTRQQKAAIIGIRCCRDAE